MPAAPIGSCWAAGSWSDTAWEALTWRDAGTLAFVLDMNTRCRVYLCDLYSVPTESDLTTLVHRYVNSQTGEMTARILKLIKDATDAMS